MSDDDNVIQLPRGVRANNIGNIRKTSTVWQGETTNEYEKSFEVFKKPEDGLRALMIVLLNYHRKYHLDTVQSIINRWAPPHENDTGSYVRAVCWRVGVKADQKINLFDESILISLAKAIAIHENGRPPKTYPDAWYSSALYESAARKAFEAVGYYA